MINESAENRPCTVTEADLLAWVEAQVEQLHAEARVLVDDYWRRLKREQKQQAASEKARIGVRIRRREASLSFSIEWCQTALKSFHNFPRKIVEKFPVNLWGYWFSSAFFRCLNR